MLLLELQILAAAGRKPCCPWHGPVILAADDKESAHAADVRTDSACQDRVHTPSQCEIRELDEGAWRRFTALRGQIDRSAAAAPCVN